MQIDKIHEQGFYVNHNVNVYILAVAVRRFDKNTMIPSDNGERQNNAHTLKTVHRTADLELVTCAKTDRLTVKIPYQKV